MKLTSGKEEYETVHIPYWAAFIPIAFITVALTSNFVAFGFAALDGPSQLVLVLGAFVAALVATSCGNSWDAILHGIVSSISAAIPSILIILAIGALIGAWFVSGVIPTIIYFGIQFLSPTYFYLSAALICGVVSVALGSSWSTSATVGIALFGISESLGMSPGITIGAIISGAYFGDKMSPLSDTTNLASAVTNVDLVRHIQYMRYTTVPAVIIALVVYYFLGAAHSVEDASVSVTRITSALDAAFRISSWLLIIPVLSIALIYKRVPPLLVLISSAVIGAAAAAAFQPKLLYFISGTDESGVAGLYFGAIKAMAVGVELETTVPSLERIMTSKGMAGMLNPLWLIVCALTFGGALEGSGILHKLTRGFLSFATTRVRLISSSVGICIFFNATAADHVLSIVVPGRLLTKAYRDLDLAPENLSRTLEDAGTVTSPLIPWSTCGAFHFSLFGVSPALFVPFCFFNMLCPVFAILLAWLGLGVRKAERIS